MKGRSAPAADCLQREDKGYMLQGGKKNLFDVTWEGNLRCNGASIIKIRPAAVGGCVVKRERTRLVWCSEGKEMLRCHTGKEIEVK